MYAAYFNFRELPFSIAPDPAFLYMSARHQEALGHLLYGTGKSGGFVQLTGEVGTGKTTIVRTLLAQKLDDVDVAMIHNPRQTELEFVASLCDELGIPYPAGASIKTLVDGLNQHLLGVHAAGRRTVLIIDEAQNLPPQVLEQVRLLTNLETDKEKLLRILLVGQPELDALLARADLRQLASRITARYHLLPLTLQETREYVRHRLRVGGGNADIFTQPAIDRVHRQTRGNPRQINILCDRALLGAYGRGARQVSAKMVEQAAEETLGIRVAGTGKQSLVDKLRGGLGGSSLMWVESALAAVALLMASVAMFRMFGHPAVRTHQAQPAVEQVQAGTAEPTTVPAPAPVAPTTSAGETAAAPVAAKPQPAAAVAQAPVISSADSLAILRHSAEPLTTVLNRLVRLWDSEVQIGADENVCQALSKRRLDCYHSIGTWSDLVQLDRPAILTLDLGGADHQYVLLRSLSPSEVVLVGAESTQTISRDRLDDLWTGEFLILWRRDIDSNLIGPQAHGAPVLWLRQQLARVNKNDSPAPATNDRGRFDDSLASSLKQFQADRGLLPDGVAGIRTLIALSNVTPAPGTPRLSVDAQP